MDEPTFQLFDSEWKFILASFFMRFSGSLSIMGSAAILYMILSDRHAKLKRIHNRILLAMSVFQIIGSIGWVMSTSAVPKGTVGSFGARGNQATCTLQGFMLQLDFGVPFYNLSLCLCHYLVIARNVTDSKLRNNFEPYLHTISILIPLTTAVAGIPLRLYNFKGALCYIEPSPWHCKAVPSSCTRNKHSLLFEFFFGGLWLIFIASSIVVFMVLIYCSVRNRERAMSRFNFRARDGTVVLSSSYTQLCRDKRDTGIQALLYVSAFFFTYIWIGINFCFSLAKSEPSDALRLLIFFFQPLQGLWNSIIYIRPRYWFISCQNPDKGFWEKLILVIFYPKVGGTTTSPERRRRDLLPLSHLSRTSTKLNPLHPDGGNQLIRLTQHGDAENARNSVVTEQLNDVGVLPDEKNSVEPSPSTNNEKNLLDTLKNSSLAIDDCPKSSSVGPSAPMRRKSLLSIALDNFDLDEMLLDDDDDDDDGSL